MQQTHSLKLALLLGGLLVTGSALADMQSHAGHGSHDAPGAHGAASAAAEQKPWGVAGTAAQVDRTIEIGMDDRMRFTPERIEVKQGETIRFVHRNDGKVMHEFVLGTRETLDKHAEMMMQHPGMAHGEAYMAHVAPGEQGEMIWTFNRAGEFDFACLIVGHYQAGMRGSVRVLGE